jgi:hypothetical protein
LDALGDDHELVTPEARQGVARAGCACEVDGGLTEDVVAGLVAVEVVGLGEVVKIDRQNRSRLGPALRACERLLERGDRRRPVGQPGEAVVGGLVHEASWS